MRHTCACGCVRACVIRWDIGESKEIMLMEHCNMGVSCVGGGKESGSDHEQPP